MQYRELQPGAHLRPFVRLLWSLQASGISGGVERIVPDGCPEIVVNRVERFNRLLADGTWREQASVLLVGQFRRALTIRPTGTADLIGIRFEPGGLHALLGAPMHELVDTDLCLGSVERRLRSELVDAAHAGPLAARAPAIEAVLTRRLERRHRVARGAGLVGSVVRAAAQGLANGTSTASLAGTLGLKRRSLERLFRTEVGLPPKLYLRILRLQSVLRGLEGGRPARGWAALATGHGYADQPHLIREFHLLVGTTPERYLAERTAMAACFEVGELSRSSNQRPGASS